jgi:O-antigen/teichoic acid export membrane protein
MSTSAGVRQASWTLIDQGLVSLGAFLVNVQLARQLPAEQFGVFALLLGALLGLQLFTSSLLLYPMSVCLPVLRGIDRERLYAATVALVAMMWVPLCAALGLALAILGRPDLIPAALALLVCWQAQETMRRGLLAAFRHSSAVYGDTLAYFGQVAALLVLTRLGALTLENALYAMAAAYAAGAALQAIQQRLSLSELADLRKTALEFWSIGGWSLGNNLLALLRVQILPWILAAYGGTAAAAAFQAVLNVVNLTNPILLGLCNVIPQTAARAQQVGGNLEAWRSVRIYMLIGAPPTFAYYALVALVPWLPLTVLYGASSPYAALSLPVQVLALGWAIGYFAEMICSYLHGVRRARLALVTNLLGVLALAAVAPNLIQSYGLFGACLALAAANIVRLAAAMFVQKRVSSDEYVPA